MTDLDDSKSPAAVGFDGYSPLEQWMARHPKVTGVFNLAIGMIGAKFFIIDLAFYQNASKLVVEQFYRFGIVFSVLFLLNGLAILVFGSSAVLFFRHRKGDPWVQKGQILGILCVTVLLIAIYFGFVCILRSR